jgi:hypothetical protein
MDVVRPSVIPKCKLSSGGERRHISVSGYVAVGLLCVEFTYDDAWCISVAWVQRIQAPSPDQRRDTRQKSDHRCKVCPSCRSLCGGLPSGQSLGVDCDMCLYSSYLTYRIRRQVRLERRNLIAGLSGKAGSTLLTLGSLVLSTFPPVAGCQSFSLMVSGSFDPLPQLGMTATNLSLFF